jgi:hypothetical protein
MLDNENAKDNASEIGYSSPIESVSEEFTNDLINIKSELNAKLSENGYCKIDAEPDCLEYDGSIEEINELLNDLETSESLFESQEIPSENGEDIYSELETYRSLTQEETLYFSEIFLNFKMSLNK